MNRSRLLLLLALLATVLAACGTSAATANTADDASEGSDAEALSVVVTTTVWWDIVSNATGDAATVEVLLPVGADAHDYRLSSAQVASMQEADLVVVNGLQLEEGILDVIESLEADGANILEVAALLDPIAFGAGGHSHHDEDGEHADEGASAAGECDPDAAHDEEEGGHDEEEGGHDEEEGGHEEEEDGHAHEVGSCDPHVWMDPQRVATAVELIAGELAALDPSVDWVANAMLYADELRTLHEEVIAMLEVVPEERRKMVTNHEAFGEALVQVRQVTASDGAAQVVTAA